MAGLTHAQEAISDFLCNEVAHGKTKRQHGKWKAEVVLLNRVDKTGASKKVNKHCGIAPAIPKR